MEKFNTNAINERIRQVRSQYAGERGKSDLARSLGLSPSTYSYYEQNRVPPIEVLLKISEITGVDLYWLLTGREDSKKGSQAGQVKIPKVLEEKIGKLLSDDPKMIEPISAFIEILGQKKGIEGCFEAEKPQIIQNRPGWIPVLGRTAAGIVFFWKDQLIPSQQAVTELETLVKKYIGREIVSLVDGRATADVHFKPIVDGLKKADIRLIQISDPAESVSAEGVVEFVQCEQIYNIYNDSFALRIDGDSMSPRINDGDIVILSTSVAAGDGQISVVRLVEQIGVTCKVIRRQQDSIHLIPINEKYQTKIVPQKDIIWALAVLCHISF